LSSVSNEDLLIEILGILGVSVFFFSFFWLSIREGSFLPCVLELLYVIICAVLLGSFFYLVGGMSAWNCAGVFNIMMQLQDKIVPTEMG